MRVQNGLLAAALNVLVLALALTALAPSSLGQLNTAAFFVLAAAFSFVEAASQATTECGRMPPAAHATGITLLAVFVIGLRFGGAPLFPWLGALLMLIGIGLRGAAMKSLGTRFLSDVQVAPRDRLVVRGLYAKLRHPSETGLLCIAAGAALLLGSTAALLVCSLVLLPIVFFRVRQEDVLLRQLYGTGYIEYAQRVSALVPWSRRR